MEFIEVQSRLFPELSAHYDLLGDLFTKKLWHQLSIALDSFLSNKSNARVNSFKELYFEFISKFDTRLNQIKLAIIIDKIGRSLSSPQEAIDFYTAFLASRPKLGPEATICLQLDIIIMKMKFGQIENSKLAIEDVNTRLQEKNLNEPVVFSKFFKASYEFRKIVGPPQDFFKAALSFLTYTSIDDIPTNERYELATDMALASICGEGVYNFGEVIATPILSELRNSPNAWMQDLVLALHRGDITAFNSVVDSNRERYFSHPALIAHHELIQRKAVLLCVLNMAFNRAAHDRTIPFVEIANKACVPLEQLEWVLMRALSIGLIKGTIDEVAQTVSVSWVQPRVLDSDQIATMSEHVKSWTERVKTTLKTVEDKTPELYF